MTLTYQSPKHDLFETIYKTHYSRVAPIIFWNLKCCKNRQPRETAEDLTQEVFIGLLHGLQSRPDLAAKLGEDTVWTRRLLHRIMMGKIIDHQRKYHGSVKHSMETTAYAEDIFSVTYEDGFQTAAQDYLKS